jgi:hypothetical protein
MFVNCRLGRFAGSVLLAGGLGAGALISVAGCGGSSSVSAPDTSATPAPAASASPAASPSGSARSAISGATLDAIVKCMESHGAAISAGGGATVTPKQVKDAFKALPVAKQQSVFAACGSLLPPAIRQAVQQRIAQETAGATATP